MLLSRRNQLLLEFSFWNEPVPRPGPNIYELRSYQLRVTLFFFFLMNHRISRPPSVSLGFWGERFCFVFCGTCSEHDLYLLFLSQAQ